jgi:hypothetical protein
MLEETFSTSELVQNIQGHVTAELFDAKTGKLVQREQTHNFVSQPAIDFLKQSQRSQFTRGIYSLNNSLNQDYFKVDKSDGVIVLTDSTSATDPANETHLYGQFIGWANKDNYSGSDSYRGTANGSLSSADDTQCTWVFDWSTSAANGTIGSVGWVKPAGFYTEPGSSPATYFPSWSSVSASYATPQTWTYLTRASSSQSFGSTGNTNISVLDASFVQSNSFSVSGQFSNVKGIAWDTTNNKLWVLGTAGGVAKVASYTATGTLVDALTTVTNRSYRALAFDGTNLWTLTQSGTTVTVYAINPTDGSDTSNFSYSTSNGYNGLTWLTESATGIAWEPTKGNLWIRHYSYSNYSGDYPQWYGLITKIDYTHDAPAVLRCFTPSGNASATQISLFPASQILGSKSYMGSISSSYNIAYCDNVANSSLQYFYVLNCSSSLDFDVVDPYTFLIPQGSNIYQIEADGMGSRALLPAPIAKTNTQTLRITYQMTYS